MNNHVISNSINLILKNDLAFDDSFPFLFNEHYKELLFLNNKRTTSSNFNRNIKNLKDFNENSCDFYKNEKVNGLKNKNKVIFKICKDYSKIKYHNHCIFSKIYRNNNYNNDLYTIDNCNNIFINKSYKQLNKLNNPTAIEDNNEDINNNINRNNCQKEKNSKNNLNNVVNSSNEIKVKKNNKMIYINKLLIKPKKRKKVLISPERKRNSIYRGVSKNGNKWQVIVHSKYFKGYIGMYKTQEIAGRIYDFISIKKNGIKAKTNFQYNLHQIQKISDSYIDYKSENIEEIISHLIKE